MSVVNYPIDERLYIFEKARDSAKSLQIALARL